MAGVISGEFFGQQTDASRRKTEIVVKYFKAWAKIMTGIKIDSPRLNYLDLFSGLGIYDDGSKSTPVYILEELFKNPILVERVKLHFNDMRKSNVEALAKTIAQFPLADLRYPLSLTNYDAADYGSAVVRELQGYPTLSFVDPFGYRGITQRLLESLITPFGSDCIFFFNYNEIQRAVLNPKVLSHMQALFGISRFDQLRDLLRQPDIREKEQAIVDVTASALEDVGGKYSLFFRFRNVADSRTMHHLAFLSKNDKAYSLMKDIMAKASSSQTSGVANLTFSARVESSEERQLELFTDDPIEELKSILSHRFSGKTIAVGKIPGVHAEIDRLEAHNYTLANYKRALLQLEAEGKVTTNRPNRRKNTLADDVVIYFP